MSILKFLITTVRQFVINYDPLIFRVADFWEWNNRKELFLSTKYQRRSVWSNKAKSYLIDTMLRGLPLPKIFMRYDVNIDTKKSIREIVDGQQRMRAILSFIDDGFTVMKVHNKQFGGLYFSQLDEETRKHLWEFKISVDLLKTDQEADILDVFARLNTYTITLNRQELLNSKYFGAFKQTVYSLGFNFKDYWVNNRVLTDKQVSRMGEAEFASELVIQIIHGLDDRKNIESYYKEYDDVFPLELKVRKEFPKIIDSITELVGTNLEQTNFSKVPIFYSLFGVVIQLREKSLIKTPYISKIKNLLAEIDNILNLDVEELPNKYFSFHDASTKHVTDLKARETRHHFIYNYIITGLKQK